MKIYNETVTATCSCCNHDDLECKPVTYADEEIAFLCGDCLVFLEKFLEAIDVKITEI